ncbi:MAG TPA: SDR family oxidoreductase [Paracoccaceae bacterium]|nr:SDR family oxidoreductase [Paracoccaceae bacterium]
MPTLSGKTCAVTGAARGIGAAIAESFLREGASVLLTDIDEDTGRATAARLGAPFQRLDVREEGDWDALAARLPGLDVLVNNAGVSGFEGGYRPHDPEGAALADWRAVMATNLDGVFLGCRTALRLMRGRGGAIINIASRSGTVGVPGAAAYAASKAAVLNHTRSVALHGAPLGVRCNAILPGAILTPMWEALIGQGPDREAVQAGFVADVPAGRFGQPEEVAALAVLLASDAAPYVTGAHWAVDGGLTAGPKPG